MLVCDCCSVVGPVEAVRMEELPRNVVACNVVVAYKGSQVSRLRWVGKPTNKGMDGKMIAIIINIRKSRPKRPYLHTYPDKVRVYGGGLTLHVITYRGSKKLYSEHRATSALHNVSRCFREWNTI